MLLNMSKFEFCWFSVSASCCL